MPITDLTLYRNKAYLELCLEMVHDAYVDLKKGNHQLAESQLFEILEIFENDTSDDAKTKAPVIKLPSK